MSRNTWRDGGVGLPEKTSAAVVVLSLCIALAHHPARVAAEPLRVDGAVALASLMSLGDSHLQSISNSLKTLAETSEARSADWARIRVPLTSLAQRSAPGAMWFALPDGTYWTVDEGLAAQKLIDRPYFPRLLAGRDVIGDLVISRSTNKSVAIVATPIMRDGVVVGAVGSSVYLDRLSSLIEKEMAVDRSMIFFSFNSHPLVGLVWDPELIFLEPMRQESEPSLRQAFSEMLSKQEGSVSYQFRGRERTVIYRRSPVTNWWYAFGVVEGGHEARP